MEVKHPGTALRSSVLILECLWLQECAAVCHEMGEICQAARIIAHKNRYVPACLSECLNVFSAIKPSPSFDNKILMFTFLGLLVIHVREILHRSCGLSFLRNALITITHGRLWALLKETSVVVNKGGQALIVLLSIPRYIVLVWGLNQQPSSQRLTSLTFRPPLPEGVGVVVQCKTS